MEPMTDRFIKRAVVLFGLLLVGILVAGSARALDGKAPSWRYNAHNPDLPFSHSRRAEAVWASAACWSECGSYCGWGVAGCVQENAQGRCLKLTDKCERYCQRQCRTWGGPLLPIEFPWEY